MEAPSKVGMLVAAIGSTPVVVAQSAPPAQAGGESITVPVWFLSIAATAALGLVGFLLKSWLEKVDSRLEKLDARIASLATQQARVEERITSLEKKP